MIGILLGTAVLAGAGIGVLGVATACIVALTGFQLGWLRPVPSVLIVAAAVLGFARAGRGTTEPAAPSWASTYHAFYATVSSDPASNGVTQSFRATLSPANRSITGQATACVEALVAPAVHRGDTMYLTGDVQTLAELQPSFRDYISGLGCSITVRTFAVQPLANGSGFAHALDVLRERMTAGVQRAVPGDAGALISGLATGDDAALSDSARSSFYATGTSHITAVSGSNLALFITFFAVVGSASGWLRRFAWQAATLAMVWAYVALIGFGPPAFRSALVVTFVIVAIRIGRKPDLLTLSLIVAAAEVLIRPRDLHMLSFQLSTASAIGMIIGLEGRVPGARSGWGWIVKGVIATTAANLATAPFLLFTVGLSDPVRSIVTNVAITPVVDALFPLSVAISLLSVFSGGAALSLGLPVEALARLCLWLVSACARLPVTYFPPGSVPFNRWLYAGAVVLLFAMASGEIRGGLKRTARAIQKSEPLAVRIAAGAAASGVVAALAAWLTR